MGDVLRNGPNRAETYLERAYLLLVCQWARRRYAPGTLMALGYDGPTGREPLERMQIIALREDDQK